MTIEITMSDGRRKYTQTQEQSVYTDDKNKASNQAYRKYENLPNMIDTGQSGEAHVPGLEKEGSTKYTSFCAVWPLLELANDQKKITGLPR